MLASLRVFRPSFARTVLATDVLDAPQEGLRGLSRNLRGTWVATRDVALSQNQKVYLREQHRKLSRPTFKTRTFGSTPMCPLVFCICVLLRLQIVGTSFILAKAAKAAKALIVCALLPPRHGGTGRIGSTILGCHWAVIGLSECACAAAWLTWL